MAKIKLEPRKIIMILVVAIAVLYLWSSFTNKIICDGPGDPVPECEEAGQEITNFVVPEQEELEGNTLWIIKLFILGTAIALSYGIVMRMGGMQMSSKHLFTLVLLAVAVYFIWEYIIIPSNLLGAGTFGDLTLDQIGTKTAMKLGLG